MMRDNFHRLLPGWMTILPGRGLLAGVAVAGDSVAATLVPPSFFVAAAGCSVVAADVCGSLFWTSATFGVSAAAVSAGCAVPASFAFAVVEGTGAGSAVFSTGVTVAGADSAVF